MIKIAIVDDERYSAQLCRELVQSLKVPNLDIIDDFESGKTFLNEIIEKKVQYDIVILDIDMPNINGFEVAKSLNELNLDTLIMFYTVHEQYVFKAYEYQPFRYIRKEFAKEELPFALKCAFEKIESRNERSIIIKTGNSELRIMTKNIEYFGLALYDPSLENILYMSKILYVLNSICPTASSNNPFAKGVSDNGELVYENIVQQETTTTITTTISETETSFESAESSVSSVSSVTESVSKPTTTTTTTTIIKNIDSPKTGVNNINKFLLLMAGASSMTLLFHKKRKN